jgi:type II secretory ATPase GspE/PulE/Tfp pilus assembly ATPase PilB-like protein
LSQGPPGTGKTSTLKGLLNSLHLREYQIFYKFVVTVRRHTLLID